ncbi:autotransporter outer membrane beta-barrel domain-containing protein [Bradyrhizobium sp. CCBAU 25338]|uniref:autotransporter outer membrane beta-barrel domain-containing protein n=1 Tax=Bradyrhizobium sp. CCBAU 25338 TaxID=1641877 RepID=UPI00230254CD|nr:autotransporter domain-containing protein [Bradyrhizobium sp. CCBAU 25338]
MGWNLHLLEALLAERSLRHLILSSSMLASAVIGYGRRAYAACVPAGGSNFLCSGASTAQSVSAANANVSTLPGFRVTTVSSNALAITGSGDLFYTDTNFSALTATSGNGLNVSNAAGPGSITINTNGAVTARNYGIRGRNFGSGALSITANGDVISTGTGVASLSRGIVAVSSGTDLSVTTGVGTTVSGLRYGILSRNYGTGTTTVTANGDVAASGTTGTDVGILARGTADVVVTTAAGTTVSGQEIGISARSDGAGALNITVNGDVTGNTAIYARTGAGGSIAINVGSGSSVTSNGTGYAVDTSTFASANGATNLTVAGTLNGGTGGAVRFHQGSALADRLELHPTAVINGTVFAGPGTDTLALGGTGTGSFDVSRIGSAAQYRDFETFEKVGASQWTLTGINTGIPDWIVNAGVLSIQATMPNTDFSVNGGTLALVGAGNISNSIVNLNGVTSVLDISGAVAGGTIASLSGVVGSAVTLGNQTLILSNASGTFGGAIAGSGGLTLDGGTERLTGISTYTGATTINGGTLLVDGSIASSSGVTANSGSTLGGTGTLPTTAINGGILSPGPMIGTLNVQGTISFTPNSTYQVDISPGSSDRTNVTGTAALAGTAHVIAGAGSYPRNTTYVILTAAGGLSGAFSGLNFASDFLCACLSYDANNVYLQITSTGLTFAGAGQTPNQIATGGAVEGLGVGNPIYDVIVLGSAEQARSAFDLLSGEVHASAVGMVLDDSRHVRDALLGRLRQSYGGSSNPLASLTPGGPVLAYATTMTDHPAPGFGAKKTAMPAENVVAGWGQTIGAWGRNAGDGNASALSRSVGGFMTGFDANVGEMWRFGVASGYARSWLRADERKSSGTVGSYHFGLYGGGQFGALGLRAGVAHTWHDLETSRSIAFAGGEGCCASMFSDTATASFAARTAQAFGEIGASFFAGRAAIEPFASAAYVNVHTHGFTESGGAAVLTANGQSNDAVFTTLGARAAMTYALPDRATITTYGMLGWRRAFGDTTPVMAMAFASGGAGFNISGNSLARNAALVEAGLNLHFSPTATIGLSYVGQLSDRVTDHAIKGNLIWRF